MVLTRQILTRMMTTMSHRPTPQAPRTATIAIQILRRRETPDITLRIRDKEVVVAAAGEMVVVAVATMMVTDLATSLVRPGVLHSAHGL